MCPQTLSGKLGKDKMPVNVCQCTLLALVKNTSLHFDFWKTATDWSEQVITWRGLSGLLNSHSDVVCYYSIRIALTTDISILMWVTFPSYVIPFQVLGGNIVCTILLGYITNYILFTSIILVAVTVLNLVDWFIICFPIGWLVGL